MKKIVRFIVLVLGLTFILQACAASEGFAASPSSSPTDSLPTVSSNEMENQSIESIILDKDGITVTYTGIELVQYLPGQQDGYMLTVGLIIDNTSDIDITVYPADSSVNGVMKTAVSGVPMTVLSGKKAVTNFCFTNFEGTGIDSVDDIYKVDEVEFYLSVYDNNDMTEIFQSNAIIINP